MANQRRSFSASLLVALATFLPAACGHVIINTPVQRQDDGWDLTLTKLTDGPNSFNEGGGINYYPAAGERFIWAHVTLRNGAHAPRKFSFDRCDLDAGNDAILPSMVQFGFLNGPVNREPELAAGETVERRVLFSYPKHQSPSRLRCAPMIIPIPQF
ncbi:MAG TPA: hypothetical protein VN962_01975 [Polyangia bacterium]|nr:hypothetical protein [Polyangia bacterium]